MMSDNVHIFGIRHHGPGSARSLCRALRKLEPQLVLVEGPADASEAIALAGHAQMKPPVALLVYVPDQPQRAAFFPFAAYSPEWQAIRYGLDHDIPVQFFDLPQAHQLASGQEDSAPPAPQEDGPNAAAPVVPDEAAMLRLDPLTPLAQAAGYAHGEQWWDDQVESRQGHDDEVFAAVLEAMAALREAAGQEDNPREAQREAYMRRCLREARKQYDRIAVVCGAWHAPALADMPPAAADNALLKGLAKVKTAAAWCPWSYDRLIAASGYGAGVASSEWYHLLWEHDRDHAQHWLTRAAHLLREQDLDCSSASVIEAVRLAETLAAMRCRSQVGLDELDEAALTVMCRGQQSPMALIRRKLITGDRLGQVPADAPMLPLQRDLASQQKRLRLKVTADERDIDLDLRTPMDLQRSHLLHRLNLLGVAWGQRRQNVHNTAGTFHEWWRLQWHPQMEIRLIEVSRWGSTIAEAATQACTQQADTIDQLPTLISLLDDVLMAQLPEAAERLMHALDNRLAVASDTAQLLTILPPLANILRYGNVRQTDSQMVQQMVSGLVTRICIGLPAACASLDDDAAADMLASWNQVNQALGMLDDQDYLKQWHDVLKSLASQSLLHGLLAGRALRILHDARQIDADEISQQTSLALSRAADAPTAAAWIEGLLSGSGMVLVHDAKLWAVLDDWVAQLTDAHFDAVLPLLRRTFATFEAPERRMMAQQARRGRNAGSVDNTADQQPFDHERARAALELVSQILGANRA